MLYWSKYIYHIFVLMEIYCRYTIIDYTKQSFLSLKCVYIFFLADPVYVSNLTLCRSRCAVTLWLQQLSSPSLWASVRLCIDEGQYEIVPVQFLSTFFCSRLTFSVSLSCMLHDLQFGKEHISRSKNIFYFYLTVTFKVQPQDWDLCAVFSTAFYFTEKNLLWSNHGCIYYDRK